MGWMLTILQVYVDYSIDRVLTILLVYVDRVLTILSTGSYSLSSMLPHYQVDDLNVRLVRALPNFAVEHSSVTLDHQGGLPLQFMLFLDPLCRAAQRISSLLRFMRDALGVSVKLVMNPIRELTGMPLKTFYRYSLPDVELRGAVLSVRPLLLLALCWACVGICVHACFVSHVCMSIAPHHH